MSVPAPRRAVLKASLAAAASLCGCSDATPLSAEASPEVRPLQEPPKARRSTAGPGDTQLIAELKDVRLLRDRMSFRAERHGQAAIVRFASLNRPRPYQKPMAVFRLSSALNGRVVPRAELHWPRLASVLDLLKRSLNSSDLTLYSEQLSVTYDGRVATIVTREPVGTKLLASSPRLAEIRAYLEATSTTATPPSFAADYCEGTLMDFLTATTDRREVTIDDTNGRVWFLPTPGAFPRLTSTHRWDALLRRIRRLRRFSASFTDTLGQLDRRQIETIAADAFEGKMLGNRQLIDVLGRCTTLLSLIRSRIELQGVEATLTL